jgi:hypothetical protein
VKTAIELIIEARQQQKQRVKRWSELHEDAFKNGELAMVASMYASPNDDLRVKNFYAHKEEYIDPWPWDDEFDERRILSRIERLASAGAYIVAEIERLQRKEVK